MKKTDLVQALAASCGQGASAVEAVLDALPSVVVTALRAEDSVILPGLVKIEARQRPARVVRNPATGEPIEKPASVVAHAKALKTLRDGVSAPS